MSLKRDPLQVDPEFRMRIKEIQKKLEIKEGKEVSIRELTKRIAGGDVIKEIEKVLLNAVKNNDINLHYDRRRR